MTTTTSRFTDLAGTVTLELKDHGEFKTSLATVDTLRNHTRKALVQAITECYSDHVGPAKRATYWQHYPKSVLVIVLGGLIKPLN